MRSTLAICLIVAGSLALSSAQAQPTSGFHSAGWKQGVDTYWPAQSAHRSIGNAVEYAQDFQNYLTKMPAPEPAVVKDVKVELAKYLDDAKKHLATMKKDFAADKEISGAIAAIEKDLATAVENHKAAMECCEHEKFDKAAGMACCKDMVKDLDKVHKAHQDLMKKLAAKAKAAK
ncbi:MAG: hypothetical protein K8R36_01710 [Planctomycetales bacterium]|nr:hypothetical protein [Planctomycetales bacterium]